ncbi:choline-responsive transcriptional repressor BetI [Sulfitobacter geojensis]|uniref:HTH-type transcriptional regulator BetI n=1 Tax=Sulfitobacter geojensis TaxID=1342299 RepID=A0AAE2VUW4_9RHOB|nr:transcriptional regulator BetI [Sulfitobacter geojensis]MBM1687637.1 transcriptional regulator BetI [Sulfitobacter geojensis]MBM1691704.1 transcriptional regulator BetI [Sulfitobacter geojensis]MBM1703870.1 transcriptional regulator BetI [Sulfitobacter geojensis]MBM1707928.1 transcriptional regulator BetI [Sulfitobacter geojensis]MBM1711993.1 transcriptional regulator BetI [Sulfitobacter geojensis]
MPKVGMEPIRRSALVQATIAEIGAAHSLDVTVGQIAKRAGMSTALAHHYFGGKDQIFLAAMRHILSEYGAEVRARLAEARGPRDRAAAIVIASFDETCFAPATVNAWMTLYAASPTNAGTRRLLRLYQRRLRSNLTHALRPLSTNPEADAETMAALIDGLYLRAALSQSGTASAARASALSTLHLLLDAAT